MFRPIHDPDAVPEPIEKHPLKEERRGLIPELEEDEDDVADLFGDDFDDEADADGTSSSGGLAVLRRKLAESRGTTSSCVASASSGGQLPSGVSKGGNVVSCLEKKGKMIDDGLINP